MHAGLRHERFLGICSQAAYRTSLAPANLGEDVLYLVDAQTCIPSLARRYPTIVVSSAKRSVYEVKPDAYRPTPSNGRAAPEYLPIWNWIVLMNAKQQR